MTTEDKSSFSMPLTLIWEAERPYENKIRRSPVFTFKNCEWYLVLCVYSPTYYLDMLLIDKKQIFPKFTVKTYVTLFFNGDNDDALFGQRNKVSKSGFPIATIDIDELEKRIPDFRVKGHLTFLCIFDDDSSTQPFASGGQQSVHFPLKAKSVLSNSEYPSSSAGNQYVSLESLSKDLEALLDNKTLPDVQLMVEETSIPCHRAVLTARSRVFAAMFLHKMTESVSGVLEIKDMDLSTTEVFLKYLYSGKIPDDLSEETLMKLFEIGDKYEVNALKKVCSSEMMKNINDENCLSYLSLGEAHRDQEFKDAVADYIVKDDTLITSSAWIQFSSENSTLAIAVYRKYVEKKAMKKN